MQEHIYAYAGSRTTKERNARGEGISVFRMSVRDARLERIQLVGGIINPSYLALSSDGRCLYTVHGDCSEVSAYAVDGNTGELRFLNRQNSGGKNPVHLAVSPEGGELIVTNHIGASIAVLPLAQDGSLQPLVQLEILSGTTGPHRIEQTQSKPHFNLLSPSGRYVIVPDKGLDCIFSFRFEGGRLLPAAEPVVATREGAGPRHAVFHPEKPLLYVVNELDSTVTTYRYREATGGLSPVHIVSCLPPVFTGNSRAAGIAVDAAGRFLYASNRGHDSIAVFALDSESGLPRFVAAEPSRGKTPRFFTLTPDGRHMQVLNEDSDTIVTFAVDEKSGRLTPSEGGITSAGSPVCMIFAAQAAGFSSHLPFQES
ncbi:MAG: lactonase family protein [Neisseria sp.]|nr:lactonase family protein [Neisseria sp.]